MGKYATHYTNEELEIIKEQWLKDRKSISEKLVGMELHDIDTACIPYLNNKTLRRLFRHTIYLYHFGVKTGDLDLHKREEALIPEVYEEIKKNGYFSSSKITEKKIANWFGKAVSRQTRHKSFKKY